VEIHHLLEAAARAVTDLAAVAVALGPGTFTGLRVGLGVAKGFHLATDVPLLGVSTLEAAALPFALCGHAVVATVSAGRGRLVWAHYAPGPDGTAATRPPRNGTPEELAAELAELAPNFVVVTGELDEEQAARLSHLPHVAIPAPPLRIRQPGALAEIAWQRWRAGERDDASAIEPIYLAR
jgi:tRNA threonylcarbamoyladenosine biosynthesis protein TsaB